MVGGIMGRAKKTFWVIAYDIGDDRRRLKVVKQLEKYGERVNLSVFECMFTPLQFEKVKEHIGRQIDVAVDTVIYYPLCMECFAKIVVQCKKKNCPKTVYFV